MKTLRFAKVAAEAERLRLTHLVRRYAGRAVLGLFALVFVISALAVGHFAAWLALVKVLAPIWAALVVVGVDLVLAIIFGALAASSSPSAAEREALMLRNMAVAQIARPSLLTGPLSGLIMGRLLRLLTSRLFGRGG